MYNRKASPIGWVKVADADSLTLLYGFNGWKRSGKIALKRAAGAPKDLPGLTPRAPRAWREQADKQAEAEPAAKGMDDDEWWAAEVRGRVRERAGGGGGSRAEQAGRCPGLHCLRQRHCAWRG